MFAKETYIARRAKLKQTIGSGLLLFLGNDESGMNYADNTYHFRQDSTFPFSSVRSCKQHRHDRNTRDYCRKADYSHDLRARAYSYRRIINLSAEKRRINISECFHTVLTVRKRQFKILHIEFYRFCIGNPVRFYNHTFCVFRDRCRFVIAQISLDEILRIIYVKS